MCTRVRSVCAIRAIPTFHDEEAILLSLKAELTLQKLQVWLPPAMVAAVVQQALILNNNLILTRSLTDMTCTDIVCCYENNYYALTKPVTNKKHDKLAEKLLAESKHNGLKASIIGESQF